MLLFFCLHHISKTWYTELWPVTGKVYFVHNKIYKLFLLTLQLTCDIVFLEPGKEDKYFLPRDGLFNYVSCPNFLCEIVIYVSLYLVFGLDHFLWAIITIWVATNQVKDYCLIMHFINFINYGHLYLICTDVGCINGPQLVPFTL